MSIRLTPSWKILALEVELDVDGRKLINHSVRKALVKKLKTSNQPRTAIIGVIGHTSERSLADYEEGDEAEQRQISSIISSPVSPVCQQVQNSRPVLSSLPIQHNHTATPACQTVVHHFHSCQVTINYGAGVGVFQQSSNLTLGEAYPYLILSCGFASPLQWLLKPWFENYFHWTIACCLPWMVWTGFTK